MNSIPSRFFNSCFFSKVQNTTVHSIINTKYVGDRNDLIHILSKYPIELQNFNCRPSKNIYYNNEIDKTVYYREHNGYGFEIIISHSKVYVIDILEFKYLV